MGLCIRSAARSDLERLEELEGQCFAVPWTREQLESQLPDTQHVFLVAGENERVLGYVGMMTVLDEGYISNVAVAPEARRRGIARALVSTLLGRAEELSLSFVTLEVREHNEPAIALYAGLGFVPVGLRKNYYDSPKENAILMTRYLK
ncbi:MAG: ribosomal protein S18-alanine N-acetyltransferase [Oscillospiraceae bacterium]|nr:ribosomal protein S18-alanine N-acetyltransferase [Oscillospiraceae bacterium]